MKYRTLMDLQTRPGNLVTPDPNSNSPIPISISINFNLKQSKNNLKNLKQSKTI